MTHSLDSTARTGPGRDEDVLRRPVSAEEFARMPEIDGREELVRGSVVREPLPAYGHGAVQLRVGSLLDDWARRTGAGAVVTEVGFILERGPDTVRGPDVAFVSRERVPAGEVVWIEGAPDLAVEIVSPSNSRRELEEKAREYFHAGGRLVWIVDPRAEEVTVHRPDRPSQHLDRQDVLHDPDALPGFRVPVAEIFR